VAPFNSPGVPERFLRIAPYGWVHFCRSRSRKICRLDGKILFYAAATFLARELAKMLALLADLNAWAALLTLTALEILLGIDNVVFVSLLAANLDAASGRTARQIGFALAFVFRIALLFALTSLGRLRYPVFVVFGDEFSWRDVILIGGGLFLIAKATFEIHSEIDVGEHHERRLSSNANGILLVIVQIALIDLVFSIDSIVTAIGMVQHVEVMIAAVLISMAVMYGASGSVAEFIVRNPSTKMLALSFLILIGVALIADGFDVHIPRGYVYFAMGFAALVETFNILARQRRARRRQ
jgi:predicted tellurium resistance membrane protein TerC